MRARSATWIPPKPGPARPGPHWFWELRHPAGSVTTGLCALTGPRGKEALRAGRMGGFGMAVAERGCFGTLVGGRDGMAVMV